MSETAPDISILICTRDRAADLEQTLAAIAKVTVPSHLRCELVVIDNGSRDHTARIVENCSIRTMPVRCVREERPGLSCARNRALEEAAGEVLLWTDDDTRPPLNWIEAMSAPILRGNADAVAGGVHPAAHLKRSYLSAYFYSMLASTAEIDPAAPWQMIGANMVYSRHILKKIPFFDIELGAGLLGSGEEALFSRQIIHAGFKLISAFDCSVEHHFETSRLEKQSFLNASIKAGRSQAYVDYHWNHVRRKQPMLHALLMQAKLNRLQRKKTASEETVSEKEMWLTQVTAMFKQLAIEQRRERNYEQYGLVKLRGELWHS